MAVFPAKFKYLLISAFLLLFLQLGTTEVRANPNFYIEGPTAATTGEKLEFSLGINSDSETLSWAQAVIEFDTTHFSAQSLSISGSNCTLWSPADSVPPGKDAYSPTPYFSSGTIVFACGFANPGYSGSDGLIAKFTLNPLQPGTTALSFASTSGYNKVGFIGNPIPLGAMSDHAVTITGSAQPTPTLTPTPTPTGTLTPTPPVAPFTETTIQGHIRNNSQPVPSFSLRVTCTSGLFDQTISTDQDGFYSATLPRAECDLGEYILVFPTSHEWPGCPTPTSCGTFFAHQVTEDQRVIIHDWDGASAAQVPEFTTLAAAGAIIFATLGYAVLRFKISLTP